PRSLLRLHPRQPEGGGACHGTLVPVVRFHRPPRAEQHGHDAAGARALRRSLPGTRGAHEITTAVSLGLIQRAALHSIPVASATRRTIKIASDPPDRHGRISPTSSRSSGDPS